MRLLFIKGHTSFSKLILKTTKEQVSHVAIEFAFGPVNIVVHSNLLGLHMELASNFRKNCTVVRELEYIGPDTPNDLIKLKKKLEDYEFSLYDFGGFLFLGISLFLRNVFKIPLPKSNLWQSTGMMVCTEWVTDYLYDKENSMITPEKLYYNLLWQQDWENHEPTNQGNV